LELEAHSVKRFKNTVMITGEVAGNSIQDILILDRTSDGERRIIMAKRAALLDTGLNGLSLELEDAFVQSAKELVRQDYDYASSGSLRYWVPQEDLIQMVSSISPREMSSVDVRREIRNQREALNEKADGQYRRVLNRALELESILRGGPDHGEWNRRLNRSAGFTQELEIARAIRQDRTLLIYRLEYYKKFSIPFGALFFVFLALPLGFLAKKSGQTVGFILGMLIAVVYWALLFTGQTIGIRMGYSPFWSMWFPNMLTAGIGLVMCLFRVRK
jgi:lipopolysaccharide export system permease protein